MAVYIEVIDTNGKVASENGEQIFNGTLCAKMYGIFDKKITKAEWVYDGNPLRTVEKSANFYTTEVRWVTWDTGSKTIDVTITYSDATTDTASLTLTLINLPG